MWSTEYSSEATVDADAVWSLWSDVRRWSSYNEDVRSADIDGLFAPGSTITMYLNSDDDPIVLTLDEVDEGSRFVDRAEFGGLVIRTIHETRPTDGGLRIVYRMEITGPEADTAGPEIGPGISADFPDVIEALVHRASG